MNPINIVNQIIITVAFVVAWLFASAVQDTVRVLEWWWS